MNQYLKTVVTAVLAISMASVLFPKDSFGKYAKLLSGIIVMAILLTPVLRMEEGNILLTETIDVQELTVTSNRYLMDEFEKELTEKVKAKLKADTNTDFSVVVYADADGENIHIKEVEIAPYSQQYAHITAQYLGIGEEKVIQK